MIKTALVTLLLSTYTYAEYRVYQYMISNTVNNSYEKPSSRIVESTLNPSAYKAYHGGGSFLTIDLLRTWRCIGDTSEKELCPSPYAKLQKVDVQ